MKLGGDAKTVRILHLSDMHLGNWPAGFGWLLDKRVLGVFTQHVRRRSRQDYGTVERLMPLVERVNPDVVVCTGDLGSIAEPSEFERALAVLKPLAERYGERFMYVPGNHDAYVGHQRNRTALEQTCLELNGFGRDTFPCERVFGDVRFIMVDAAAPMPPWKSGGLVADDAMRRLEVILQRRRDDGERRVIVCHFPMMDYYGDSLGWRRKINIENNLRQWAEDGRFDVLLCGHLHKPFVWRHSGWTQVCAGSMTIARHVAVVDINETIKCNFMKI